MNVVVRQKADTDQYLDKRIFFNETITMRCKFKELNVCCFFFTSGQPCDCAPSGIKGI